MSNTDASPITTKALVSRGPFSAGQWALEDVTLRVLKPDEVAIEIVASGICHTDLHCGDTPTDQGVPGVYYPRVLGHEGQVNPPRLPPTTQPPAHTRSHQAPATSSAPAAPSRISPPATPSSSPSRTAEPATSAPPARPRTARPSSTSTSSGSPSSFPLLRVPHRISAAASSANPASRATPSSATSASSAWRGWA